jgi:hypothetical protein
MTVLNGSIIKKKNFGGKNYDNRNSSFNVTWGISNSPLG